LLGLDEALRPAPVNEGFFGGEKKRNEILPGCVSSRGWRFWTRPTSLDIDAAQGRSPTGIEAMRSPGAPIPGSSCDHYQRLLNIRCAGPTCM